MKLDMWVDFFKGSLVGFVLALVSLSLYIGWAIQTPQTLTVLVFLIVVELFLLYLFVWRGNGKKVKVDFWHLVAGILIGFVVLTAFLMLIFALPALINY